MRSVAAVVALTLVLLLLPPAANAQQVDERMRTTFARGETFFRNGRPQEAIVSFTAVVDALVARAGQAALDNEAQALLVRSLAYRADANLGDGQRNAADADFEQLITSFPSAAIDGFGLSDAATERFERAQARLLGNMTFSLTPFDARLRVDGVDLAPGTTTQRALAGTHLVEAFLPGFTRASQDVEVRADRNVNVDFELRRVSAVIKLMSHPVGATVVIDGNVVGQTSGTAPPDWTPVGDAARLPRHEFSGEMEIEGLMPGQHEVEILLDGYRPFSAPLTIPDLGDFQVGAVVLSANLGLVLLRDLPQDAEVWVDGARAQPEPPVRGAGDSVGSTAYRLSLVPGTYRITVSRADAGVFEETVTVADRRDATLTVRLRPGLTFLGVTGEDRLGAETLQGSLRRAFDGLDFWAFLDRGEEAAPTLRRSGVTVDALRAAAGTGSESVDWQRLQATVSRELPGSIFALGVLAADQLAAQADIWIWAAAPAPPFAERVRVSLTDRNDLDTLARRLSQTLRLTRPWSGLELVDSGLVPSPVVAGVAPGGPADVAGIRVGERLVSVAGNVVATAANAHAWLANFDRGAAVSLGVIGPEGERVVDLRMDTTPLVVPPARPDVLYSVVWGMTAAAVGRMDAAIPSWLAQLNQASVLLHARDWAGAARMLQGIQAPAGGGLGQGMVDYWLGLALAQAGDVEGARTAWERALQATEARYLSNDGPLLAPLVRARLYALGAAGR